MDKHSLSFKLCPVSSCSISIYLLAATFPFYQLESLVCISHATRISNLGSGYISRDAPHPETYLSSYISQTYLPIED